MKSIKYFYFRNANKGVYKFLVGNKCDMEEKRKVTYEQGKEFAESHGMKFFEASAKTAHNVGEAFVTMTKEIIAQTQEKEKNISKNDSDKKDRKIVLDGKSTRNLNASGGYLIEFFYILDVANKNIMIKIKKIV